MKRAGSGQQDEKHPAKLIDLTKDDSVVETPRKVSKTPPAPTERPTPFPSTSTQYNTTPSHNVVTSPRNPSVPIKQNTSSTSTSSSRPPTPTSNSIAQSPTTGNFRDKLILPPRNTQQPNAQSNKSVLEFVPLSEILRKKESMEKVSDSKLKAKTPSTATTIPSISFPPTKTTDNTSVFKEKQTATKSPIDSSQPQDINDNSVPIVNNSKPPAQSSNFIQQLRNTNFSTASDEKLQTLVITTWETIPDRLGFYYDRQSAYYQTTFDGLKDFTASPPESLWTAQVSYPSGVRGVEYHRSHGLPLRFIEFFRCFDIRINDSDYMRYLPAPVHETLSKSESEDPRAGTYDRDWEWFIRKKDWVAAVKNLKSKQVIKELIVNFLDYQETRYKLKAYPRLPDDKPYTDQEQEDRIRGYKEYKELDQIVKDIRETFAKVNIDS